MLNISGTAFVFPLYWRLRGLVLGHMYISDILLSPKDTVGQETQFK